MLHSGFFAASAFSQPGTSGIPESSVISRGGHRGAKITLTNSGYNANENDGFDDAECVRFDLLPPLIIESKLRRLVFADLLSIMQKLLLVSKPKSMFGWISGRSAKRLRCQSVPQKLLINTQDASLANVFDSQQITRFR